MYLIYVYYKSLFVDYKHIVQMGFFPYERQMHVFDDTINFR